MFFGRPVKIRLKTKFMYIPEIKDFQKLNFNTQNFRNKMFVINLTHKIFNVGVNSLYIWFSKTFLAVPEKKNTFCKKNHKTGWESLTRAGQWMV